MGALIRVGLILVQALFIGIMAIAAKVGMEVIKMVFKALKTGKKLTEVSVTKVVAKMVDKEKGKIL